MFKLTQNKFIEFPFNIIIRRVLSNLFHSHQRKLVSYRKFMFAICIRKHTHEQT
jgi:hypothetical protein